MNNNMKLIFRYLLKQKSRTIRIIMTIIIAVTFVISCGIIGGNLCDDDIQKMIEESGQYHFYGYHIDKDTYEKIKNEQNIETVGLAYVEYIKDKSSNATINYNMLHCDNLYFKLCERKLISGRYPRNGKEIIIDNSSKEKIEDKINNNKLIINNNEYSIVGGCENLNNSANYINIETILSKLQ